MEEEREQGEKKAESGKRLKLTAIGEKIIHM